MSKKTPAEAKLSLAELEAYASRIRNELKVPKQNDVFRVAVEAGYLTALADGTVDSAETATMVRAIEMLSEGAVIEWETEELLAECAKRAEKDGASKRAESAGAELKALGQAEVGLLFAALVAGASKGIDKKEAETLKAVGAAAGLAGDAIKEIVKRANAMRQTGSAPPPG
jgi:tellurite resistance protein